MIRVNEGQQSYTNLDHPIFGLAQSPPPNIKIASIVHAIFRLFSTTANRYDLTQSRDIVRRYRCDDSGGINRVGRTDGDDDGKIDDDIL
ncbi:hypothetical protein BOTCAL_0011g00320 [Botryotinia calthae]|uniref:Uncharacterized protein n=1 Tax=Botryotinia calthae TaxID=38488 RepID=A0A4Y8DGE8_9HELO|nr:hypothetical protein BOTCAL_0011g00320 [Botryotinia calthae]